MVFESGQYTKLTRIYVRYGLDKKPINIKITIITVITLTQALLTYENNV